MLRSQTDHCARLPDEEEVSWMVRGEMVGGGGTSLIIRKPEYSRNSLCGPTVILERRNLKETGPKISNDVVLQSLIGCYLRAKSKPAEEQPIRDSKRFSV